MSKDRDYIKELFDSDGIKAPESLSEENMLAMLEAAEEKQAEDFAERQPVKANETEKKMSWKPYIYRWAAVAAAAVICLFGISGLFDILGPAPDTSVTDGGLYTFRSEREISKVLKSMDTGVSFGKFRYGNSSSAKNCILVFNAASSCCWIDWHTPICFSCSSS